MGRTTRKEAKNGAGGQVVDDSLMLSQRAPDPLVRQMSSAHFHDIGWQASISSSRDLLEELKLELAVSSGGKVARGTRHAAAEAVHRRELRLLAIGGNDTGLGIVGQDPAATDFYNMHIMMGASSPTSDGSISPRRQRYRE